MNNRYENVLSTVITLAIVAMAVAFVRRKPEGPNATNVADQAPELIDSWQQMLPSGSMIGSAAAPVKIVEFSDMECPYCARFHNETYPSTLARIDSGRALSTRLRVAGTPTLMINGWLFRYPRSDTAIARTVRDLVQGKTPYQVQR